MSPKEKPIQSRQSKSASAKKTAAAPRKPIAKRPSKTAEKGRPLKPAGLKQHGGRPGRAIKVPGKPEDRYRAIVEETDLGYGELDLAGNFTFVNQAGAKNIGYKPEDLIGKNYRDFMDQKSAEKLRDAYNAIYKTGKPLKKLEVEFRHKNGTRRIKEMSAALIRDAKGRPAGFHGLSMDVTSKRRLADALRTSEELYRSILEEVDEGYGEMDIDGKILFVNEAAAKNIGYAPEELIGKNFRSLVGKDEIPKVDALYQQVMETGRRIRGLEVEMISKDGLARFVEVSGTVIRDGEGHSAGFRCMTRDITERKWTEEALLQSEARYLSIIESIGHAYFETDLRGVMTFINDKVCVDLGYSRQELLSMSPHELQDPDNAKKTFEAFHDVFVTGRANPAYTYEFISKSGKKLAFEMSISLIRDAQGQPTGFRGLSRDITERKKMEEALRASEERARTIIATIPDPYFETNLKGQITYINQAFQSLTGYPLDELTTMDYRTYLDQRTAEDVYSLYNTVYTTGMTLKNAELQIESRRGEKRAVNLSVSLIVDPQGKATGFHGILRDVTEKKAAEALILESEKMLRAYSEDLEQRVSERTAELEKAKTAAEAASRVKSEFLANISHEFQTPLNSIIGFTKVLQDRLFGELNDKQAEFVAYIAEAGTNLSKLLTEIIDVSQVSTGRTTLKLGPVSISQALMKTLRLLEKPVRDKNQILTVNVSLDADISIEADEEKIGHIFFHLLGNANKYTQPGGTITVTADRTKDASGRDGIAVSFRDTGPGIRPEDVSKLFQNFGRLESAYARESGGIGVGLSLTRQLAELHGGGVSVDSELGCGSTFTVFLPLKQNPSALSE